MVQVKVSDGVATPVFGLSALLSVLTAADGYIVIPEEATGLDAGTEVDVILLCLTARSSVTCRPHGTGRVARGQGRRGLPGPAAPPIAVPVTEAAGLVTAAPVWATRSSPPFDAAGMDGIADHAPPTRWAPARRRPSTWRRTPTTWSTPATRCPPAGTRS